MIFVIDSDVVMRKCVARACEKMGREVREFDNAIEAMSAMDAGVPEMIFTEVMLTGPDGFTFLNEMASYADTGRVPVVLVTELALSEYDLSAYGVVGVLNKETMDPREVFEYAGRY